MENFRGATQLDSYLAIIYYQTGVSNFLLGTFEAAFGDFEGAFDLLRQPGHVRRIMLGLPPRSQPATETVTLIRFGLKFQLHACAVLFNQCVSYLAES